jgi:hypothetical protein
MSYKRKPYFYDSQYKRMILQVMSCFTGYMARTGNQRDGRHRFLDIPILFADYQSTVGYILQGGSENTVAYVPIMSCFITGSRQANELRQAPQHFERLTVTERAKDADGNLLINVPGRRKTIERFQPVPYEVSFDISIWASNYDQQFQILEQIQSVFNPDMDIALSNSLADWTFLTSLIYSGETNFEKAAPAETDIDPLNVVTLPFTVIMWLSLPARVYDSTPIFKIKVPILDLDGQSGSISTRQMIEFDSLQQLDMFMLQADEDDVIQFTTFN